MDLQANTWGPLRILLPTSLDHDTKHTPNICSPRKKTLSPGKIEDNSKISQMLSSSTSFNAFPFSSRPYLKKCIQTLNHRN